MAGTPDLVRRIAVLNRAVQCADGGVACHCFADPYEWRADDSNFTIFPAFAFDSEPSGCASRRFGDIGRFMNRTAVNERSDRGCETAPQSYRIRGTFLRHTIISPLTQIGDQI